MHDHVTLVVVYFCEMLQFFTLIYF